eukprot:TRINITY_DN2473_c0_g1_i1.p1 TRINITY_DN2473_c0_g1~~TRINITY_DN2473_c0_g1_i1.p1  ORF type:complete len:138 (-),score=29.61 TRINITY_DN2473_c0_g1_i1:102-515(-)
MFLALDLTARNLQNEAKTKGLPWTQAKGYDTFCPLSNKYLSKESVKNPDNLVLALSINGKEKQRGSTQDMIFKIPDLIAHISAIMTLEEGDLILTGTPEGVGSVYPGEEVTASLSDGDQVLLNMTFKAIERPKVVKL